MKAIPIISLMLLALAKSVAQEPQSYSQEFKDALRYGAKAKVTIKVVDDTGKPVKNADVKVFFRMTSGSTEGNHLIGVSDATGMFMAKSRTTDTVFISVEKDEYYMSVAKHGFQSLNPERLKDGCWLPWNSTVPVVLKKIRTPVPMILSYEHMHIPQLEKAMGLDLEKGDWVGIFWGLSPEFFGVCPLNYLHLIEKNVDIFTVRDWLGHADIRTTNLYVEVSIERKRAALAKVPPPTNGEPVEEAMWKQPELMAFLTNLSQGVMLRKPACLGRVEPVPRVCMVNHAT